MHGVLTRTSGVFGCSQEKAGTTSIYRKPTWSVEGVKLCCGGDQCSGSQVACHLMRNLNSMRYWKLLADNLVPLLDEIGHDLKFQQDNAPIHATKLMREWFAQAGISLIHWPAKSSDLNTIENVWALLKRYVDGRPQKPHLVQLEHILMRWSAIVTTRLCTSLYAGLPYQFEQVIAKNGSRIERRERL